MKITDERIAYLRKIGPCTQLDGVGVRLEWYPACQVKELFEALDERNEAITKVEAERYKHNQRIMDLELALERAKLAPELASWRNIPQLHKRIEELELVVENQASSIRRLMEVASHTTSPIEFVAVDEPTPIVDWSDKVMPSPPMSPERLHWWWSAGSFAWTTAGDLKAVLEQLEWLTRAMVMSAHGHELTPDVAYSHTHSQLIYDEIKHELARRISNLPIPIVGEHAADWIEFFQRLIAAIEADA